MVQASIVLGWIGLIIYAIIFVTFQKMLKHKEHSLLHLLMAFMYSAWLPLPIVLYQLLDFEALLVGTIFGYPYLIIMILSMSLQTSHIIHILKQDESIEWEERAEWMMETLSGTTEGLANLLKSIWALFLAMAFWQIDQPIMAFSLLLFVLMGVYVLLLLIRSNTYKQINILKKIKGNPIVFNIENIIFFTILMVYLTIQ